jgi:hypothetical protein
METEGADFPDPFSSEAVEYDNHGGTSLVHIQTLGRGTLCGSERGATTEVRRNEVAQNVSECPLCAVLSRPNTGVDSEDIEDGTCPFCSAEPPGRLRRKVEQSGDDHKLRRWLLDHLMGQQGPGCQHFEFDAAED